MIYTKNDKKSISSSGRFELFIVLAAVVLILTPVIIGLFSSSKKAEEKRMELYLSTRSDEFFGKDTTEMFLRGYEKRNPDLRIMQINATSDISADTSAGTSAAASGQGQPFKIPDILIFDDSEYSSLVADGALLPLAHYFHVEGGDEQFAIPLVSFMNLLFYNIEILEEAGFDRPPKTRDEFLAYSKAVSGDNISGFSFGLSPNDKQAMSRDIFSWIWAGEGDFWPEDSDNGLPVTTARYIINSIAFLGRLYREGSPAPKSFETTGAQRLDEFAQGKIAMMIASSRDIPALRRKMGENIFGITAIPGAAGKYNVSLSGYYAGISSECRYPDEAWDFLLYLVEQIPLLCAKLKAVPGAVSDLSTSDYIKEDPFYYKAWEIFAHPGTQVVQGFSGNPYGDELERVFREEMRGFFESSRTATETAAVIQQKWTDILE